MNPEKPIEDQTSNWGEAIEMTVTMLGAIVLGVILTFYFDSFWPVGIVFFGCCVAFFKLVIQNYHAS